MALSCPILDGSVEPHTSPLNTTNHTQDSRFIPLTSVLPTWTAMESTESKKRPALEPSGGPQKMPRTSPNPNPQVTPFIPPYLAQIIESLSTESG